MPQHTPFHARFAAMNQTDTWFPWSGYELSDVLYDMEAELKAIREQVALIDMSPLPKYEFSGPDAARLVDLLIIRDVTKLAVNQIYYTPFCNEEGLLVNDGLVFRLASDHFRISSDNCWEWFKQQAEGMDVQIADVLAEWGILSLQGPRSREVLETATGEDWSDFRFSRRQVTQIGGINVEVSRQGFTGEHGYELWVRKDDGLALFDAVWDAGQQFGLQAAGEHAAEIARLEAGLPLISADYNGAGPDQLSTDVPISSGHFSTPFEMGMGYLVDFKKGDFIGKQALRKAAKRPARQLVGLELDYEFLQAVYDEQGIEEPVAPRIRWDMLPALAGSKTIGRATSIGWSPTLGKLIGFGCISTKLAKPGSQVAVQWPLGDSSVKVAATVVETPFIQRRRA